MLNGKRTAVVLPAYNAAKTLEKTVGESQASPAIVPKAEPTPPVPATGVAASAPTPDSTQPETAPPGAATAKATPKNRPKTEPALSASAPANAASDRSSPRCSRIMEKATLGETLSIEEKKELASSCR